jgi:hypothetical protein
VLLAGHCDVDLVYFGGCRIRSYHIKTILVLIMGCFFFGKDGLNLHVVLGMIIAVVGMIWHGKASSKPGG